MISRKAHGMQCDREVAMGGGGGEVDEHIGRYAARIANKKF